MLSKLKYIFVLLCSVFVLSGTPAWAIGECRQHTLSGFAEPCPVLNVDGRTAQDQSFEIELTPTAEFHYILPTIYIYNNGEWQAHTLSGTNGDWITERTLRELDPQELNLNPGFYTLVSWDWVWDAEAGCYKGAGLDQCETGQWRVTTFEVVQRSEENNGGGETQGDTTFFYVDPDYSGRNGHEGSQRAPWSRINWDEVNAELREHNVTVYFSAQEARANISQDYEGGITIQRTDKGTNRLTLDGMTKWNRDDNDPDWIDFGGDPNRKTSKCRLSDTGNEWALGWGGRQPIQNMNYLTIRGFELTGPLARMRLEGGGKHMIVEYNYVHDVSVKGPGMSFNAGSYSYNSSRCDMRVEDLSENVIFRNNIIERVFGEGLYIGGAGGTRNTGFPCRGHHDITVEDNEISHPGLGGGEGDCLDIKNGNSGLDILDNTISHCSRNGISILGGHNGLVQDVLIDGNTLTNINTETGSGAILMPATWQGTPSGVVVSNNRISQVRNGRTAINFGDGDHGDVEGGGRKYNIEIRNNTVTNSSGPSMSARFIHGFSHSNNNFSGSVEISNITNGE